jgi:hypothetical protein
VPPPPPRPSRAVTRPAGETTPAKPGAPADADAPAPTEADALDAAKAKALPPEPTDKAGAPPERPPGADASRRRVRIVVLQR